jgi:hypothetical protein
MKTVKLDFTKKVPPKALLKPQFRKHLPSTWTFSPFKLYLQVCSVSGGARGTELLQQIGEVSFLTTRK